MDYQPGIVGRLPDPDAQLELVAGVIARARQAGLTVGYVRVAFTEDELAAVPPTNLGFSAIAASGAGPAMHADAPGTQVHDAVAPQPEDIVVRKTRVGAFSTTDLHEQLRDRGVDTIVLAGISTSGVVLSTVRDGADRDYRIYVLSDASADPDPATHVALTERVFPRQAHVLDSQALFELLPTV
jgi:nicotinamidase-related amidase